MVVLQLVGIALVTAVAALILKETKPELAFAVSVAGGIILVLFVLDAFQDGLSVFGEIAEVAGIDNFLVKTVLKMVGIGYLVEFSAGVLADFGQNSLADKLTFCGKILIFVLAVPIIERVLKLILSLLELL